MGAEISYMLVIVLVGFAVNYGLRALPFILFAGRDRQLPEWILKFGSFLSPVIIAGLIIYSYATLRTLVGLPACSRFWPYLAGAVTIGLHLWKRNPLASIVAGTVVYMCLLNCGCASSRQLEFTAETPAVRITVKDVRFAEEVVDPRTIPSRLESYDVPKSRTIHIRVDPDVRDYTVARAVMAILAHGGYKRPMLVTERHAESFNIGRRKEPDAASSKKERPCVIRYKGAGE